MPMETTKMKKRKIFKTIEEAIVNNNKATGEMLFAEELIYFNPSSFSMQYSVL